MKMKTNIARGENLMTRAARVTRWVVIGGMASLVAMILPQNTDAEMMPGAIGNDGANGFDGTITVKTRHDHDASRIAENAINGGGLTAATGLHDTFSAAGQLWLGAIFGGTPHNPLWYIVDLGATYSLDRMDFWNYGDLSNSARGVKTADIYFFGGSAEPNPNNIDQNPANPPFDNAGWNLFQSDQNFTAGSITNPFGLTETISFGGTAVRFVALNISENYDTGSGAEGFVAISEMQFFAVPTTPVAFTNVTVDPAIRLDFASDDGQDYRLEFTTSPTNLVWQDAGFTIRGDGGTRLALDPAVMDSQKTYRITPF